jgi:hypothetical protein
VSPGEVRFPARVTVVKTPVAPPASSPPPESRPAPRRLAHASGRAAAAAAPGQDDWMEF